MQQSRMRLDDALHAARERYALPALAGAWVSSGAIETAAAGTTQLGSGTAATPRHYWHIGSNGKAVTATLAGLLVSAGKLAWDSTPEEGWPGSADARHPDNRGITLRELLLHRSGLPPYCDDSELAALPAFDGDAGAQAAAFARYVLSQPGGGTRGSFAYSNAGYAVAGAMLAQAGGQAYTDLLRTRLLAPLGLDCHYGWPLDRGTDQPWGHTGSGGRYIPHDPADGYRLPPFLTPVGDMALPLGGYARFVQLHLRGQCGLPPVADAEQAAALPGMTAALMQDLHTAVDGVSCGWSEQALGGTPSSGHEGSAGTFHCITVIQPERERAVTVIANAGGESAADAVRNVAKELLA
jgi:CubicO group peptidase (beta-lactamase class C family)